VDPFINGLAIGFAIAAPVGPIGVLCIRRTLAGGTFAGLASGLGAACADALYAAMATFALALATTLIARAAAPLHVAGGLFLIVLAVRTVVAGKIVAPPDAIAPRVYLHAFLTTFVLTAINPTTIFSFAGTVAGAGFGDRPQTPLPAAARLRRVRRLRVVVAAAEHRGRNAPSRFDAADCARDQPGLGDHAKRLRSLGTRTSLTNTKGRSAERERSIACIFIELQSRSNTKAKNRLSHMCT
jgi:hypothetical protein